MAATTSHGPTDYWVAKKDLVELELELRTYLHLRTYNAFEMLKYHERKNLEKPI